MLSPSDGRCAHEHRLPSDQKEHDCAVNQERCEQGQIAFAILRLWNFEHLLLQRLPILPRRPAQVAPAKKMDVQVEYGLT